MIIGVAVESMVLYWALFGVGLAWMYAVGHCASSHTVTSKLLLVTLFGSLGVIQLCWSLLLSGHLDDYPVMLYLHQPALFLIGPTLYCYSQVIGSSPYESLRVWPHMIPAMIAAGFSVGQYMYRDVDAPVALSAVWLFLSAGIGAWYVGVVLRRLKRIPNPSGYIRVEMIVLMLLMLIGGGVAVAALVALFTGWLSSPLFLQVYLSMVTGVLVLSYWLGVRYPELVHYVAEAAAVRKYENSTLDNVDVNGRMQRLEQLMLEEHAYQEDSLSLGSLAQQLQLTAHQLSELLNEHKKVSFSTYVKTIRVAEAQRRLLAEPDEAILSIGLAVGFSSSSAFYSAFREVVGCPPGKYRKQQG